MKNIPPFISSTLIEAFGIINKVKGYLGIYDDGNYSVISEYLGIARLVEFEDIMRNCAKIKYDDIFIQEICWKTARLTELTDNNFILTDIGLIYSASSFDNDTKEPLEGKCNVTLDCNYQGNKKNMDIKLIKPYSFKYESVPEWITEKRFFIIEKFGEYLKRYEFDPLKHLKENFDIEQQTAQRWLSEYTVPKSFAEKKKDYYYKISHYNNIAKEMFDPL
jgi:hypothetical protein